MDYSEKIKAIQQSAGVDDDGIATSKTWIAIYHLLHDSVPYNLNIGPIIKAVQRKIMVRESGHASPRTWDVLFNYLMDHHLLRSKPIVDPQNEIAIQRMAKEVAPFAKELVRLSAAAGIHVRLNNGFADDATPRKSTQNFGLVFEIGVYERTITGEYLYQDYSPQYELVAKIGESIGLTWAGDKKVFTHHPFFELRPAWAVRMKEGEMMAELCRRKKENINLLAIL
jgi:peptidoglycan LD-endopeptidase CwlK